MDLQTLILSALVEFLAATSCMALVYATRRTYPGFGWWLAGSTCRLLSVVLFLLPRDRWPAWLAVVAANALLVVEVMLYAHGTAVFRGRAPRPAWMLPVMAAFLAVFSWYTWVDPSTSARIVVRSLFVAGLAASNVALLLRDRPPWFGAADRLLAGLFGGMVAFVVVSIVDLMMLPGGIPDSVVIATALSERYGMVVLMVSALLATFAQLLMNVQRVEYEHGLAEARLLDDIRQRERVEESLRLSEERHRFLAENARDVLWTMNLEGRILDVSPSVEAVRGFPRDVVLRQSGPEIHPPESLAKTWRYLEELRADVKAGGPLRNFRDDLEYFCSDGSTFWTEVMAYPIRSADGSVQLVGVTRDISQRKQAEARKAEMEALDRQLRKSESLSRMAGAIAHHINNQLTVVTGYIELAMTAGPEGSPRDPGLARILDKAMHASLEATGIASTMLTYLGQATSVRRRVDLSEVCAIGVAETRRSMPRELLLETQLASPGPVVDADADQIRVALGNLLRNACEATAQRPATIRVSVRTSPASTIPARYRFPIDSPPPDGDCACVEVTDPGCGISEEEMEQLFDPFYTTKLPGRGIGLPAVLGIVRAHGGCITVESRKGSGSTFRVYLPLARAA